MTTATSCSSSGRSSLAGPRFAAGGGLLHLFADVLHAGRADVGRAALQAVRGALHRAGVALRDAVADRGDLRRRVLHEEQHQFGDHVGLIFVFQEAELFNRFWIDGGIAGIHARRIGHGWQHHRLPRPDAIGAGPRAPQCGLVPLGLGCVRRRRDGAPAPRWRAPPAGAGWPPDASSRTAGGRLLARHRCSTITETRRLRGIERRRPRPAAGDRRSRARRGPGRRAGRCAP